MACGHRTPTFSSERHAVRGDCHRLLDPVTSPVHFRTSLVFPGSAPLDWRRRHKHGMPGKGGGCQLPTRLRLTSTGVGGTLCTCSGQRMTMIAFLTDELSIQQRRHRRVRRGQPASSQHGCEYYAHRNAMHGPLPWPRHCPSNTRLNGRGRDGGPPNGGALIFTSRPG